MSIRAELKGFEAHLRLAFGDADGKRFGVQPRCQPPPWMGQFYTGIDFGGFDNSGDQTGPESDDRYYSALVVCTFRLAYAPTDRRGAELLGTAEDHLYELADRIAGHVIGSWELVARMNEHIAGFDVSTNGYVEPYKTASCGPLEERGPDWVHAGHAANPPTVFSVSLRFGGARRVRVLGTVT